MSIAHYRKTIVAVIGGILAWAQVAYVPDGHIDRAEYYGLAVALATAFGVYGISNRVVTAAVDVTDAPWGPVDPVADAPADPGPVGSAPGSIWPAPVLDVPPASAQPVGTDASAPAAVTLPNDGGIRSP